MWLPPLRKKYCAADSNWLADVGWFGVPDATVINSKISIEMILMMIVSIRISLKVHDSEERKEVF